MMNEELNPIEEQALDAFLLEALGETEPVDFTDKILVRLREEESTAQTSHAPGMTAGTPTPQRNHSHNKKTIFRPSAVASLIVVAVAATLLIAVGLRWDHGSTSVPADTLAGAGTEIDKATRDLATAPNQGVVSGLNPRDNPTDADVKNPIDGKRRGIKLAVGAAAGDSLLDPQQSVVTSKRESDQPMELTLVSQQIDSELRAYWDAIGMEPSDDAVAGEVVKRLALALGVKLLPRSIDDPQKLHRQLSSTASAEVLARNWLQEITAGGVSRIPKTSSARLAEELAACFRSESRFDRVLASFLQGESPNSAAFLTALSAGAERVNGAMVHRLAALTMNVDLRCTRCHDSYIEGSGRQEDYWAFTALLGRGIRRSPAGKVMIDETQTDKPVFYELPDGRQRLVEPRVAATWIKSDQPITSIRQWTKELAGSPELAKGVVNSLWQMVHGQPLSGRVVDPVSAPHHESLAQLEDHLIEDLIRSEFDLSRTLSLIIASPPTRLQVPPALWPENSLVADDADRQAAKNAVNAFAAAMPSHDPLTNGERLNQVHRAMGSLLRPNERSFVGQIGESNGTPKRNPIVAKTLSADFPDRADAYPVQWLRSINDDKSRIKHLGYLAGLNHVSRNIFEAADQMELAGISEELKLHRIWWLIRP